MLQVLSENMLLWLKQVLYTGFCVTFCNEVVIKNLNYVTFINTGLILPLIIGASSVVFLKYGSITAAL